MIEYQIKATVRYDGGGFAGWQIQPGARTVQGEIERVLSLMASEPVRILGASRTDAGVHALGQVFCFKWKGEPPLRRLRKSISQMLSPDVRVESMEVAPEAFHPIYSAVRKRYAYTISLATEPDPFSCRYAWRVPKDIDLKLIAELGRRLVGTHDFAGYRCLGGSVKTTVRTVYSVEVVKGGVVGPNDADDLWRIEFVGNGFLYKMVRNLTGTLVDIARGHLPETRLAELLESPGPFPGQTAPALGLFLVEVEY